MTSAASAEPLVKEVRGSHCRTTLDLFAEWARVLDFPDYFGHNWDAFEECLFTTVESAESADSAGAAGSVTVVVRDAAQLLVDEEPRQLATFLAIVDTVGKGGGFSLRAGREE
ncbi:Barstar (barnase inhibitor) [Streptomyces sp. yr375]|uniref:barstar family protein n=1 Tax=Streptomyces sp. yr375 TaxID=1761906 RepID=UPI0008D04369|nr:barstar family protein [Streptomyces sp. yr375]SEP62241.1 Barstar (barnase inhibitor) [Streptomyces sp. yr375]